MTIGILLAIALAALVGWLLGQSAHTSEPLASPTPTTSATLAPPSVTPTITPPPTTASAMGSASSTAGTTTAASSTAGSSTPTFCRGPFPTPLPPLDPGTGSAAGAEGDGCNTGIVPTTGAVTVPAGWTIVSSYTCSGSTGTNGMADTIAFTAHNPMTNTDLPPVIGSGPWGHGESGAAGDGSVAPAGSYVIRVSLVHPAVNNCLWQLSVHRGAAH